MERRAFGESGASVSTAALGELLKRLRRAAVDGVVPEREFVQGVRALAVDDAARDRLRDELARLGLRVGDLHVHADIDSHFGEKVVGGSEKSVNPRVVLARGLLARYADTEGCVTSRVVEGVVRLSGLDAREAAELLAGTGVRPDAGSVAKEDSGPSGTSGKSPEDASAAAAVDGPAPADEVTAATGGDLSDAVAAALAVLEADRFERRPGKRLLTAQAEVGLTVLVRGGADRVTREPDEEELKALPRDDLRIRARDCLIVHNQGLVHSLVRTVLEQGLEYEDLFQHGALGLMRATRKFDPMMGNKFSTYATWWIRQSLTRAIADEGALIRVPVHMHEQMRKVARAERALAAEGRRAGDPDIAVRCDMTLQKVQEIRRLTRRTDSLDRVIGDGATLADFVAETHVLPSVEQQVVGALFAEDVLAVVDTFTEREARILVRRLGLDGDEPSTLDDLGREFGVTRERIRQIEVKARPVLRQRVREAGLVGLDAVCEKAELAAERAAEAKEAARFARATHAVRTALREARAERLARRTEAVVAPPVAESPEGDGDTPIAEAEPAVTTNARESTRADAVTDADQAVDAGAPNVVAADWERARRLSAAPVDQVWWLADYARAALGEDGLAALLGQPAADVVVRDAREDKRLSRPVLTALEVLRRVLDALVEAGQRPGDFFDRPAEALAGTTPRDYLVRRPLVNRESRLAVRDTLREFLADAPTGYQDTADSEQAQEVRTEEVPETPPPGAEADTESETIEEDVPLVEADTPVAPPQATADWDKALALTEPPLGGNVTWLAEYALLALGHLQLSVLLGPAAADAVVRAARQRGTLDRHVVQTLEVLEGVLAAVKRLGLRPEHFFESPTEALAGATPRAYLTAKPLVHAESRLAIRDALQGFGAAPPEGTEPTAVSGDDDMSAPEDPAAGPGDGDPAPSPADAAPVVPPPVDAERLLAEARARYEAEIASLTREHELRLGQERSAADERVAAVRAEAERELHAWEDTLLARMDVLLLRRERRVRAEAEERIAQLEAQHHAAYGAALSRAEKAEESARSAQEKRDRTRILELRLRQYREDAETRIKDLESRLSEAQKATVELEARAQRAEATVDERMRAVASAREEYRQGARLRIAEVEARLREAEAAVAQRDLFVEAARRSAQETEQQAAQRIAQSEHNSWLRITDLQTQLSEAQAQLVTAQEAERSRGSLRDRWRRT